MMKIGKRIEEMELYKKAVKRREENKDMTTDRTICKINFCPATNLNKQRHTDQNEA